MTFAAGESIILAYSHTPGRPYSIFFAVCLGISISLHIASVLIVAYISTRPVPFADIHYLEVSDLAQAPRRHNTPARLPEYVHPAVVEKALSGMAGGAAVSAAPESFPPDDSTRPDIQNTPLGLGMSYGFVSSLADGVTLREDIREYYLALIEKINGIWWERAGDLAETARNDGIVELFIQRDGSLLDRRILKGTGSRDVDRALLHSIDQAAPMPALPTSFRMDVFAAPLKITAPSHLFRATTYK